jgi:hypothetical protein
VAELRVRSECERGVKDFRDLNVWRKGIDLFEKVVCDVGFFRTQKQVIRV